MNKLCVYLIILLSQALSFAYAGDNTPLKNGDRIYQQNSSGQTQYHKEHYTVEGKRLIPTNAYGRKQYHKPGYTIEKGKVYQTDSYGRTQYHKPGYKEE